MMTVRAIVPRLVLQREHGVGEGGTVEQLEIDAAQVKCPRRHTAATLGAVAVGVLLPRPRRVGVGSLGGHGGQRGRVRDVGEHGDAAGETERPAQELMVDRGQLWWR